jgi:two-component system LytT family sensor kinase
VAELLGSIAGFAGAWLVIMSGMLHEISKGGGTAPAGPPALPPQILIAMPAIAFAGGVLLSFSIANYVMRAVLGASPWAVAVMSAILFWVMILGAHTILRTSRFLYQSAQEQAQAAARAEAQVVEAQLAALQAQMQPHFLFNALNTVASLVRTDPRRAERTVENLADVLRQTLRRSRAPLHPLGDEIELLESYLALEQERLGERLRVVWSIGSDTRGLHVPPLTLQPLVENALEHAIGSRIEGGTLRIGAMRDGDTLRLTVEDDGEGFKRDATDGIGLGNLRQRLATMFGDRASLRIESTSVGARVVVAIPAHV